MEVFKPDKFHGEIYRATIKQSGGGNIDRYIYSQDGEGIGSFFGNLFRTVAPMVGPILGKAIKGAAQLAEPHIKQLANDAIAVGSKRLSDKIHGRSKRQPKKRKFTTDEPRDNLHHIEYHE